MCELTVITQPSSEISLVIGLSCPMKVFWPWNVVSQNLMTSALGHPESWGDTVTMDTAVRPALKARRAKVHTPLGSQGVIPPC